MAVFQPPPTSFPVDAFQQLVPRLIAVLQAIQNDDAQTDEPRHRLAVAAAVRSSRAKSTLDIGPFQSYLLTHLSQTEELKKAIADAKTLVDTLPGGQMLLTDQDAVIAALESLKARKE